MTCVYMDPAGAETAGLPCPLRHLARRQGGGKASVLSPRHQYKTHASHVSRYAWLTLARSLGTYFPHF